MGFILMICWSCLFSMVIHIKKCTNGWNPNTFSSSIVLEQEIIHSQKLLFNSTSSNNLHIFGLFHTGSILSISRCHISPQELFSWQMDQASALSPLCPYFVLITSNVIVIHFIHETFQVHISLCHKVQTRFKNKTNNYNR